MPYELYQDSLNYWRIPQPALLLSMTYQIEEKILLVNWASWYFKVLCFSLHRKVWIVLQVSSRCFLIFLCCILVYHPCYYLWKFTLLTGINFKELYLGLLLLCYLNQSFLLPRKTPSRFSYYFIQNFRPFLSFSFLFIHLYWSLFFSSHILEGSYFNSH